MGWRWIGKKLCKQIFSGFVLAEKKSKKKSPDGKKYKQEKMGDNISICGILHSCGIYCEGYEFTSLSIKRRGKFGSLAKFGKF